MNKPRSDTAPLILKDADTKVNVVEGVLQNYLDQLLVTATEQPQKIEKVIEINHDTDIIIYEYYTGAGRSYSSAY